MKRIKNIGVDVGNFDTKTQNTVVPSGFEVSETKPFGTTNYLEYNGAFYVPSNDRFSYERDKTINENCFILSLIAIASEIQFCAESAKAGRERQAKLDGTKLDRVRSVQDEIFDVETVNLGVGLPPTHVSTLQDKLISYYKARFGEGVEYKYNGYTFRYKLGMIKCFPQDFAAILTYHPQDKENSAISFPSYYGIDIGGWTVDVVTILDKRISINKCDSKPLGVLAMHEKIVREVETTFGRRLMKTDIENILKGERILIPEDVKTFIKNAANKWYEDIMKSLKQFGVAYDTHPVIFLGGGALLFKDCIKKDQRLVKYELMYNPKANAAAYAALLGPEK